MTEKGGESVQKNLSGVERIILRKSPDEILSRVPEAGDGEMGHDTQALFFADTAAADFLAEIATAKRKEMAQRMYDEHNSSKYQKDNTGNSQSQENL